jgi:hypothetical protein
MKTIYVAGPFRGKDAWEIEQNVRRAEEYGWELAALGAVPVIPHTMFRYFHGSLPDQFWLDATLEILKRCDAILLLPGWTSSEGSIGEHAQAKRAGQKIFDVGMMGGLPLLRRKILEWMRFPQELPHIGPLGQVSAACPCKSCAAVTKMEPFVGRDRSPDLAGRPAKEGFDPSQLVIVRGPPKPCSGAAGIGGATHDWHEYADGSGRECKVCGASESPVPITVEGCIAHDAADLNGDVFELKGFDCQDFAQRGFLTDRCTTTPRADEVVGHPLTIDRPTLKEVRMTAKIFEADLIKKIDAGEEMGFAVAGKILERNGSTIKRCDLISVAIVPADKLIDPRCTLRKVESPQPAGEDVEPGEGIEI